MLRCIDVSVLYIAPLSSVSSPNAASAILPLLLFSLTVWTDTRIININFISSFCVFFPSISLQGFAQALTSPFPCACYILSRCFSGQNRPGFDLYHHSRTRLDLCNFYGPSVRISARYKTPNSPFFLPFPVETLTHAFITESSCSRTSIAESPEKNQPLITSCAKRQQISALFPLLLLLHRRCTQFH